MSIPPAFNAVLAGTLLGTACGKMIAKTSPYTQFIAIIGIYIATIVIPRPSLLQNINAKPPTDPSTTMNFVKKISKVIDDKNSQICLLNIAYSFAAGAITTTSLYYFKWF